MSYKLGKLPAKDDPKAFKLTSYLVELPEPPAAFRHPTPPSWPMFANDRVGDCVWAGAAHETMLWEHESGRPIPNFTDQTVLAAYRDVTGYDPSNPSSDQGTDMGQAAAYRRKNGLVDIHGIRHKVDAYTRVALRSPKLLKAATWLMGGVGIGFVFYAYNMTQFKQRQPWAWKAGGKPEGGHYVPVIGYAPNGNLITVSWGREQEMTEDFAMRACDEIYAYVDFDRLGLQTRMSPEGFDKDKLLADLAALA